MELKESIGAIGAQALGPQFRFGDDIQPRYWFTSADEYFLLQLQPNMPNMIAFNWRKRSPAGEPSVIPYPGFEHMSKQHAELVAKIFIEF